MIFKAKMTRAGKFALAATILLFTAGCTVPFPVYSVTGRNVEAVRALPASVELGSFSGSKTEVSCRLQPIGPENNQPFSSYIKQALQNEITISGVAKRNRMLMLSGALREIDVSCGIVDGAWTIEMDMQVNGGTPFTVKTVRTFDGNYFGAVVAQRAYAAFVPAVQQFVYDVLNHPTLQNAARNL